MSSTCLCVVEKISRNVRRVAVLSSGILLIYTYMYVHITNLLGISG